MIAQGSAHEVVFVCAVSADLGLMFMQLTLPLFSSLPSVKSV
jgi:hypothetical protein